MANDLTKIAQMVDPEVMENMVSAELPQAIKFTAIAPIDNTLEGQPGSTITVPRFEYIGDAKVVAEGGAIDYNQLKTSTTKITIQKIGVGVKLTDEAVLSGYGDPVGEAVRQIAMSIASKVDNDILATASKARLKLDKADFSKIDFIDEIEAAFVDDESARNVEVDDTARGLIFMHPKDVNKLRKAASNDWDRASELGDTLLSTGVFGGILGWQIERSRKIPEGSAVVVKAGALKTYMKRGINSETGRDMDTKSTKFNADQHYGVAIEDDTKLLVIKPFNVEGGDVIDSNIPKQETGTASTDKSKNKQQDAMPDQEPTK